MTTENIVIKALEEPEEQEARSKIMPIVEVPVYDEFAEEGFEVSTLGIEYSHQPDPPDAATATLMTYGFEPHNAVVPSFRQTQEFYRMEHETRRIVGREYEHSDFDAIKGLEKPEE